MRQKRETDRGCNLARVSISQRFAGVRVTLHDATLYRSVYALGSVPTASVLDYNENLEVNDVRVTLSYDAEIDLLNTYRYPRNLVFSVNIFRKNLILRHRSTIAVTSRP